MVQRPKCPAALERVPAAMSEPMSSVEIEDVLSSIRRLVSEDLRPAAATSRPVTDPPVVPPAPLSASPAVSEAVGSKLILTPALRVVADDPPQTPAAAESGPDGWDEGEVAAFVNVEDDAMPDDDMGWRTTADVVSLTRSDATAPSGPMPAVEETPWEADAMAEAPADLPPLDWQDALPKDAAQPEDDFDAAAMPEAVTAPEIEEADFDAVWADAAEAEVLRQLAEDGPAPSSASPTDEDLIDEENLLRELVRDILREELQGDLGERITRNVRKLVRAEIARAMALRDFD